MLNEDTKKTQASKKDDIISNRMINLFLKNWYSLRG